MERMVLDFLVGLLQGKPLIDWGLLIRREESEVDLNSQPHFAGTLMNSIFPRTLQARRWLLLGAFLIAGFRALANPASELEAQWFAGEWKVGPAPVDGFETIVTGESIRSVIRHVEGSNIEREITLKGQLHIMQYEVRSFGGNFPWWGENGGNYVSKKLDEDSFALAPVGPMGKADWNNAWLYERLESVEE